MSIYDSVPPLADLLGVSADAVLSLLIIAWSHWVFIEIVVQILVVLAVLKGLEFLALRFKLLFSRLKERRKKP